MSRIILTANSAWYLANFRRGLISALRDANHELIALVPIDHRSDDLSALGCEVQPLRMNKRGLSPAADAHLLFTFWQKFRELRPDIVLSFTIKNNIYGALAARQSGVPFIPNISGLGTAFAGNDWLSKLAAAMSRSAFRNLPRIFFQNESDKHQFVSKHIVQPTSAVRLPGSGVNLEHFKPETLKDNDDIVFLLMARLLWDKGIGEYAAAARQLRATGQPVRFQLLGSFEPEGRGVVDRHTVDAWQQSGTIEYLGSVDDVRPHIARADCVVLPSYYREGVPRSLLEGAAMARPLITTDRPGCRDVVKDGANGYLCRPMDAADLAAKMGRVASLSKNQRRVMGLNARRMVEERFDERVVIKSYLDAISEYANMAPPMAPTPSRPLR